MDVRANCFCASLLYNQIHTPSHAWKRAPSNEVNDDRADGHYYNFAWIQRSWTFGDPYFSFARSFYLPIFYVSRKHEENLSTRSLITCKLHHQIPFFLVTCMHAHLSIWRFSNASWRVKFCGSVVNIWNYLRKRPTATKYDWDRLPPLTHRRYVKLKNPVDHAELRALIFQN